VKQALRAWYDGSLDLDADYHLCAAKAQAIHRFRTGRGAQCVTEPADLTSSILRRNALIEDTFVQLSADQRKVVVRNVRTRTSWTTVGDARETILAIAASDLLVAFTTSLNVCYVADVRGEHRAHFKLPPGMTKVLACSGPTVVCGGPNSDAIEVYVWNYDTRRGKSFRIGYDQSPFAYRTVR
jgi:hypothetical protein